MIKKIDGQCFKNLIEYGVKNLNIHRTLINHINVFPVPDGDTGTNMVVTIKNGLAAISEPITNLSTISQKFAKSIVSGARGNSGVIASQFLKGISETLSEFEYADTETFLCSLEHGVLCAYSSVSEPVEGTILTVIKTATKAARKQCGADSNIDDVINVFIENAKLSLEQTPELLPQLKDAGVVDSGGSGIVYFFEGMKKYLDGESIDVDKTEIDIINADTVDYSVFNKSSSFPFGYCTELLIQLLYGKDLFSYSHFKSRLNELGSSIVTSLDDDKVKIHIHTLFPEKVLDFCHKYGEFLTLKIENMTVQHTEITPKIIYADESKSDFFSIVAVASTERLQKVFTQMGVNAVIRCDGGVKEDELIEIFDKLEAKPIILFPNDKRSLVAAQKVAEMYKEADVKVINSLSAADCYAALPMIDFYEPAIARTISTVKKVISGVYTVKILHRNHKQNNYLNDYLATDKTNVIAVEDSLEKVVKTAFAKSFNRCNEGVVTVFTGEADIQEVNNIFKQIISKYDDFEFNVVETNDVTYDVMISLE